MVEDQVLMELVVEVVLLHQAHLLIQVHVDQEMVVQEHLMQF